MIKYIILLISCSTVFGQQAFSIFDPAMQAPQAVSGATCSTVVDDQLGTTYTAQAGVGRTNYTAGSWLASASASVCKISIRCSKYNSPTQTITPLVYSDSGNKPSALIATGTSFNAAACPATNSEFIINISFTQTNGVRYWLVLRNDSSNDTSNLVFWYAKENTILSVAMNYSPDGTTWYGHLYRPASIRTYQ